MKEFEEIIEEYPDEEFLKADGFDDCLLGVNEEGMKLIYSVTACINKLVTDGMEPQEAEEYFEFNVSGSYMGEKTPIWCYD